MIEKRNFGTLRDGRSVFLYTLKNKEGTLVEIITFGGIIKSLHTADRLGTFQNVVLGARTLAEYENDHLFLGATIGRYCNRIAGGKFFINGKEFNLPVNNHPNHLHGGPNGFYKKLWNAVIVDKNTLMLSYESRNGEEGYPGNLLTKVFLTLNDDNELKIKYEAICDAPTPVNFTNHSYFNLHGDFSRTIHSHQLLINSDTYTPFNEHQIPTGEIKSVSKTPLDFRHFREIGIGLEDGFSYDHNYVLNQNDKQNPTPAATLYEEENGRELKVYTTEPGMQFYSGNSLDGSISDAEGNPYKKHTGLCLETQHFPDSPNQNHFTNTILQPGETFHSETVYQFSAR